jgi:hypothetical protein
MAKKEREFEDEVDLEKRLPLGRGSDLGPRYWKKCGLLLE